MKNVVFLLLLVISHCACSQIDWSNYSTSFEETKDKPSIGVAIPYNGNYDNFDKNIVGISDWNPGYKLNIDTALNDETPLFFVYDTTGIYFLVPRVNEKNAADFEFRVLLNNKITVTPWSHITHFTQLDIGDMAAGSGITRSYRGNIGQYLVARLRNSMGKIVSSMVIYFKQNAPDIKSLSTSDNAFAFSNLVGNENYFDQSLPDVGWHRLCTGNLSGRTEQLKLPYNENNVLIDINAGIYKKAALEYAIFRGDKKLRKWAGNEYNNHYILLKNLDPGDYRILMRYKRQRNSITELRFSISPAWYNTTAFRVFVLVFLILAATSLIALSKYRNQKTTLALLDQKAEQSADELKSLHTLLNPHFTFNALNSIQGLVNKGDVDGASKYLSSFGKLLRETLKESKTGLIPISKELENLKSYITLEQLRHCFTYNLSVDPNLDLFSAAVPPFLLQPFVENAIKHALSKRDGSGELSLELCKSESAMSIKINDNGPGFDPGSLKEGYGLSLSRKRIKLLNREYGEELIRLQVKSTDEGTSILLLFKNWI